MQAASVSGTWKPGGRATVGAAIDGLRCSAMCTPLLGRLLPLLLPWVCLQSTLVGQVSTQTHASSTETSAEAPI